MNYMHDLTPQHDVAVPACASGCERRQERQGFPACTLNASGATNGCGTQTPRQEAVCDFGVENGVGAALYMPLMRFDEIYDPDTAIRRGTMFAALDKPFYGDRGEGCGCGK